MAIDGLTDSELEILVILWGRGPCTVREVYEAIPHKQQRRYTTVLKMLQVMHQRGVVQRNEEDRAHRYSATQPAAEAKRNVARDLLRRFFDGSASSLVLSALGPEADPGDVAELVRIIDKLEKK